MRPKKRILLATANEVNGSVLKYMLEINRFAVKSTASAAEALETLQHETFDAMLCEWPLTGIERLLDQAWTIDADMRSLVLAGSLREKPQSIIADAVLLRGGCSPAELIERLKVLCARKRGPKSVNKPPVSEMFNRPARLAVSA